MSDQDEIEYDFSESQGAEGAEKESASSGGFAREVEYLRLKGDPASKAKGEDSALVRFLTFQNPPPGGQTDRYHLAWITVQQHYAPTKPKPDYARENGNWPKKMSAVCRKDKVFSKRFNHQCLLDDAGNKSSAKTWALGVEREEVRNEEGRIIGIRDKTREVIARDENGEPIIESQSGDDITYARKTVPAFVVINQSWSNFFGPLSEVAKYYRDQSDHDPLLDSDWRIIRSGDDTSTTYTFVRVDGRQPMPEGNPFDLAAGTPYDLGIPGLMEKVYPEMPDLRRSISRLVSEEFYGFWFVPGWSPPEKEGQKKKQKAQSGGGYMAASTPATPDSGGTAEPTGDALAALQQRVSGASRG